MMRLLSRFGQDERGASMVELALVAPFLATLVIGIIDISFGYSAKLQLEQAAQRAIEKAMNAERHEDWDEDSAFYETLKAEAATAAGVAESAVEVEYWLECDGDRKNTSPATMAKDYEEVCDDDEYYARYVSVEIEKTYDPMFNVRWAGANADGTFTLVGEAGVRVQ